MSVEEELDGQRKFKARVCKLFADATVEIGPASATEMYPVTIRRPGKVFRFQISGEAFADLANDDGVATNLAAHVRDIMGHEPAWKYKCPHCSNGVSLYTTDAVTDEAMRFARQHHELEECEAKMTVE